MAIYTRQLECLNCSHARSFVHHIATAQRLLSQAEALTLPRAATLTCGRCGSASVLQSWGDDAPYASHERAARRRRASGGARAETPMPIAERRPGAAVDSRQADNMGLGHRRLIPRGASSQ
jgi:hypothetical protein